MGFYDDLRSLSDWTIKIYTLVAFGIFDCLISETVKNNFVALVVLHTFSLCGRVWLVWTHPPFRPTGKCCTWSSMSETRGEITRARQEVDWQ